MANPAAVLRILVTANGAQAIGSLRAVEGQAAKTSAAGGRMGKAFATFAKVGFGAAAIGAVAAGKEFLNFQQAMTQVETQAGASHKEVVHLTGAVKDLAKRSQFAPTDLAKGLYRVESAGFRGAHAMRVLNASQKLAAIGNSDLELTTKAVTATMNTNIKGAKGLSQTIGTLNAAVGQGDMRMNDLIGALSTGILPAAKSAGLGLRDVTGAIDIMTRRGVPAEAAATRLRMTFSLLGAPTKQAAKALASIGLNSTQLADDMRKPNGLVTALSDLKQHLMDSGKNATEANAIIARAFGGGRSSSAIQTLLQNVGELSKVEQDTTKHANDVNAAYQRQSQTVNAQLKTAWSSIQVLLINFGSKVAPAAAQAVTHLAHALESTINFFSRNKTALAALKGALIGATAAWLAYRVAALYAAAATTIATGGLNLVVPAVIAFSAAVAIAYQKSATFREIVSKAFSVVKTVVTDAVHVILTVLDKFLGGLQSVFEAASHLPGIGKKFGHIADDIGHAREKVRNLRDAVDNLNGRKVSVEVQVNALLNEFQSGKIPKLITGKIPAPGRAMGGLVVGGSGSGDKVPLQAMVEPGEQVFVLNRNASSMLDYLQGVNAAVPRFAVGGKLSLSHPGGQIRRAAVEMGESASARWLKAHPALPAVGGGGGAGRFAANQRLGHQMMLAFGYPESEWGPFNTLEMHEAGWNPFARNPSSGAFGIPQAYPASKLPAAARRGNVRAQIAWMLQYIRATYGTPSAAWAQYYHHAGGVGSYQRGGLVAKLAAGGFFPAAGTNYSKGKEPELAKRLGALGKALGIHLVGLSGYRTPQRSVEVGGFANDPHTKGLASDTPGIEGVSESQLKKYGLTRPFGGAKERDHIQLLAGWSKKHAASRSRHWNPFKKTYQFLTSDAYKKLQTRWQKLHPKLRMPTGPTTRTKAKVGPGLTKYDQIQNLISGIDLGEQAGVLTHTQAMAQENAVYNYALGHAKKLGLTGTNVAQLMADQRTLNAPDTGGGDPNQPLIDALQAQTDAENALKEQLQGVRDEMKRNNDINEGTLAVTAREATRAMTDVLAGQLGYRVSQAGFSPGFGVGARY